MKTILLPGFGSKSTDTKYRKFFPNVLVFTPKWNNRTLTSYRKEFMEFLNKEGLFNTPFRAVGFSMGALILATTPVYPVKTVYASLTPLFSESLNKLPNKFKKFLGKNRLNDLYEYVPKSNSYFFVGENEADFVKDFSKKLNNGNVRLVPNTGHNIFQVEYVRAINDMIN